jgi:hypothetical protein
MSVKVERFSDLSVESKVFRIQNHLVMAVKNNRNIREFLENASDLDSAFIPVLLMLVEECNENRDVGLTELRSDVTALEKFKGLATTTLELLAAKVEKLGDKSPGKTREKSVGRSPGKRLNSPGEESESPVVNR